MAGERILVVEDNPANLELVSDLLLVAGYRVVQAGAAAEAIALAKAEPPALILMDIGLPGMDGLAAATLLKQEPALRRVPIMALTAQAMKGDEARARAAGCDDYVTKPLNTREFPARVARLIAEGTIAEGTAGRGAAGSV